MREIFPNVLTVDDQRILTPNLAPGIKVYDEELHTFGGVEYRSWNPMKSKLGAFIVKGGRNFPFTPKSRVLYLGAANGTTPSHVSDIVQEGILYAVEFSPRSFRDLLGVAQQRPNMVPLLADAWRPELYERFVGTVDVLFQDIAQRQQAAIFAKNLARFRPKWAILAVKARSVDVAKDPRDVYRDVAAELEATTDYAVAEMVDLGPFEKDHAALVLTPRAAGAPRAEMPRQQPREQPREQYRDDRPRGGGFAPRGGGYGGDRGGGGGGFERRGPPRDDRPRGGGYGGDRGGGFERRGPPPGRDDRPRGGGFAPPGDRGFDRRGPPPGDRGFDRRGPPPSGGGGFRPRDDRGPGDGDDRPSSNQGRRFDKRARDRR